MLIGQALKTNLVLKSLDLQQAQVDGIEQGPDRQKQTHDKRKHKPGCNPPFGTLLLTNTARPAARAGGQWAVDKGARWANMGNIWGVWACGRRRMAF